MADFIEEVTFYVKFRRTGIRTGVWRKQNKKGGRALQVRK